MSTTTTTTVPRGRALLFGLNYAHTTDAVLNGCINDVRNISDYLNAFNIPCDVYTDDVDLASTSAQGMIRKLYELAVASYKENLDFVWIHYSGHGTYVRDSNGDEKDGRDECLVPSDFKTAGVISDDLICSLFKSFNSKTRVVCVFDCCHSATIGDMKYSWEGPKLCVVENIGCAIPAKVTTISGCLDSQTSADAYNVDGTGKFTGALTSCLLYVLRNNPMARKNVFQLINGTRAQLRLKGFTQIAKLCSTHNLAKDMLFMPY